MKANNIHLFNLIKKYFDGENTFLENQTLNQEIEENILKLLISDVSYFEKISSKFLNDNIINMALASGLSVDKIKRENLSMINTFMACFSNYENFYLLPDEFKYPLNFAGACLNNQSLLQAGIIPDRDYLNKASDLVALLAKGIVAEGRSPVFYSRYFNLN